MTQVHQILQSPDYAQDISRAGELLSAGKLILLPTETVYGIAGLLTHPQARQSLVEIRAAATPKPLTIHLARREDAQKYVGEVGNFARRAMRKLWPGPVGLIIKVAAEIRAKVAADLGVAESDLYEAGEITLRCPDHPVFFDIASRVQQPIALIAPNGGAQRAADLPRDLLAKVAAVYDAGPTRLNKPSTLLRLNDASYELVRVGVYDQRIIDRLMKTTILFVCSGNTCRSPMAEGLARQHVCQILGINEQELENRGITVTSAGAFAMPGARATPQGVEAMKRLGLDISRHRSRPLTAELIHQADAVFAMSQSHVAAIQALAPWAGDKVSTLDPEGDIEDPIGGDLQLYVDVAERLRGLIQRRVDKTMVS